MSYKYTLIISQYYFSRHMFIVHHKQDFIEKAKSFSKELMLYKRDEGNQREIYLGDLDYFKDKKEVISRYNINDSGDIYFIQSNYANRLMEETKRYHEDSIRGSKGYQKKAITNAIGEHHNYGKVKEILEKYFEIA